MKCPICDSQRTNKNEYGFECLKCGYMNNKEFINEKIKKGEIKVEFIKKPKKKKKVKKKESEESLAVKIKKEVDKAEQDWRNVYHDAGEISEADLSKLIRRMTTKFKQIKKYAEMIEEKDREDGSEKNIKEESSDDEKSEKKV